MTIEKTITKVSTITINPFADFTTLKAVAKINDNNEMNIEWFLFNHHTNAITNDFSLDHFKIRYDVGHHMRQMSNSFIEYCDNNEIYLSTY